MEDVGCVLLMVRELVGFIKYVLIEVDYYYGIENCGYDLIVYGDYFDCFVFLYDGLYMFSYV